MKTAQRFGQLLAHALVLAALLLEDEAGEQRGDLRGRQRGEATAEHQLGEQQLVVGVDLAGDTTLHVDHVLACDVSQTSQHTLHALQLLLHDHRVGAAKMPSYLLRLGAQLHLDGVQLQRRAALLREPVLRWSTGRLLSFIGDGGGSRLLEKRMRCQTFLERLHLALVASKGGVLDLQVAHRIEQRQTVRVATMHLTQTVGHGAPALRRAQVLGDVDSDRAHTVQQRQQHRDYQQLARCSGLLLFEREWLR
mmetsp:Transcript_23621/g.59150  ORF Transcript_23621/g.59150 Transcript_23621/m.59150 type:complete len:251 (+) Transcript_23621:372-1124(+)